LECGHSGGARAGRGEGGRARPCAPTPPPHRCPPRASRPRAPISRDQDIGIRGAQHAVAQGIGDHLPAAQDSPAPAEAVTRREGRGARVRPCALTPPPAGGGGSGAVHGCAVERCGLARLGSGGVLARARPAPPALPGQSRWRGALLGGAHACAHTCALAGPRGGRDKRVERAGAPYCGLRRVCGAGQVVQRTSSKAPAGMFAGERASSTSIPVLQRPNHLREIWKTGPQ
jgi:hypothetical protein